ncbi:hypothetical protein QBC36DRAFT_314342 [Triangularia setosa]|uniref:Uncharacterized protein n=1 Tax=Triangularia setosa TaxID=2587417 RepID=A0AAN6W2A5_9PEZI|nr:hypothetical protein QBC36DRAFT_314342 [Podospora setosa]
MDIKASNPLMGYIGPDSSTFNPPLLFSPIHLLTFDIHHLHRKLLPTVQHSYHCNRPQRSDFGGWLYRSLLQKSPTGPSCVNKRDVVKRLMSEPILNVRQDVGRCTVPRYKFQYLLQPAPQPSQQAAQDLDHNSRARRLF